ncbi:MAG: hypothetical protein ABI589_05405 [Burkholderiales bacterium]
MATDFASVKLSSSLVDEARQSARSLRRSIASQIEYWATLGRVVEHSGLTAQEAQTAIAAYEKAARTEQREHTVANLSDRIRGASADGTFAQRVRDVVMENRGKGARA